MAPLKFRFLRVTTFVALCTISFVFNLIGSDNNLKSLSHQKKSWQMNERSGGNDRNHNSSVQTENNFNHRWMQLKQLMCPKMQPNPNVFLALFELARMELNFAKHRIGIKIPTKNPTKDGWEDSLTDDEKEALDAFFFDSFFKFNSGGMGYSYDILSDIQRSSHANTNQYVISNQQMVYLRVFKAGNNQIRENLNFLLTNKTKDQRPPNARYWYSEDFLQPKSTLFSSINIPPSQLYQTVQNLTDPIQSNDTPQSALAPTCIITAIRDPIEHFLSAYNEVENRAILRPSQWKPHTTWIAKYSWTRNESPLLFTRFEPGSNERFEQFVMDLVGGPTRAGIYPDEQQIVHIYSMAGILWGLKRLGDCHSRKRNDIKPTGSLSSSSTTSSEYPRLSGYLTTLQNLDTEFPKFVMDTCPGFTPNLPPFELETKHLSQKDKYGTYRAAKAVWKEGGRTARALCAIRAMDYACFDKVPVPDVCQTVFSSDRFLERLELADRSKDGDRMHRYDDCGDVKSPF